MDDIITSLSSRRTAILKKKEKVQANAAKQVAELEEELLALDEALKSVKKAVSGVLCPHCGGSGMAREKDADGQTKETPCDACHGTGVARSK
jgi:predicted RNA-binding Zn-ribbon protein involved in translation (DUF1610 family)